MVSELLNPMKLVGFHKQYTREGGAVHEDQRRLSVHGFVGNIFSTGILLLLAWLLKVSSDNGALLATLVERTGNQTRAIEAERADRATADAFMQREIEEVKVRR